MQDQTTMTMSVPDGDGGVIETGPFTAEDLKSARDLVQSSNDRQRMKPDKEFDAASDKAYRVTAGELRQFIERAERLDAEKKDISDQSKEVFAEAKARGYDTKCIRKIIAERKRSKDDLAEEQAVMDLYREALGM